MSKKMEKITLEFIPYSTLKRLSKEERLKKIIEKLKNEKILLIEGKLDNEEKKELIVQAMQSFNFKFKGIEIETIDYSPENFADKIKYSFVNLFFKNKMGLTIIGPASVIREIKKDINNLQIYMT
ncbi:MAG: DUF2073 domain-containing protein [Candidatus Woesearchaeota archaeon]